MIFKPDFKKTDDSFFSKDQLEQHLKHHQTYYDNMVKIISDTEYEHATLEDIVLHFKETSPSSFLFNNASQVYNHNMFFEQLSGVKQEVDKSLDVIEAFTNLYGANDIIESIVDDIVANFPKVFGSGWLWIVLESYREFSSPSFNLLPLKDGDTPLYSQRNAEFVQPLIAIDLWEHAHYIDFFNDKKQYVETLITHLDWSIVNDRYLKGISSIKDYTKPFEL